MENDRLTKRVFNADYQDEARDSWCTNILCIFQKLGLQDIYTSKVDCDLSVFESALQEYFVNYWKDIVRNKPKLRMYNITKTSPYTELYLKYNMYSKNRSMLAQLRFGILPIAMETGRYRGLSVENRICLCCNSMNVSRIRDAFPICLSTIYELKN